MHPGTGQGYLEPPWRVEDGDRLSRQGDCRGTPALREREGIRLVINHVETRVVSTRVYRHDPDEKNLMRFVFKLIM